MLFWSFKLFLLTCSLSYHVIKISKTSSLHGAIEVGILLTTQDRRFIIIDETKPTKQKWMPTRKSRPLLHDLSSVAQDETLGASTQRFPISHTTSEEILVKDRALNAFALHLLRFGWGLHMRETRASRKSARISVPIVTYSWLRHSQHMGLIVVGGNSKM